MSYPVEPDFALIKRGDGAGTEVFTLVCGMQDVSINSTANLADRFRRDCAKPGASPTRKTKLTGRQWDVTAGGLVDKAQMAVMEAAVGKSGNWKIELYQDDGTDTGTLLATYAGAFRLASFNVGVPRESDATAEITLASDGDVTLTLAP